MDFVSPYPRFGVKNAVGIHLKRTQHDLYRKGQPIYLHEILKHSYREVDMTRRKIDNPYKRKTVVSVRLTDVELEVLETASRNAGLSRVDYLRNLILQIKPQIHFEVVADMDDLRKLVAEYGKIGSNLNQIAKHFNAGGERSLVIQDEIRQCITDLFSLRQEVLRLAGDWNGNVKTHKK